ncbi:hypothetical protein ABZ481_29420 [Micromonospora aurantiaca]
MLPTPQASDTGTPGRRAGAGRNWYRVADTATWVGCSTQVAVSGSETPLGQGTARS